MPKLRDVAVIQTGLTLRGRPEILPSGSVRLMQLGDVDVSGLIHFEKMAAVEPQPKFERFQVNEGDLVFRGRAGISVVVVPKHHEEVVVVSPLIIIRPFRNVVEPEYLAWFLKSPKAHRHYARHMQGTSITGVGKKELETLEIDLPDLETQRKITKLLALQRKEEELLQRYQLVRKKVVDAVINRLIVNKNERDEEE